MKLAVLYTCFNRKVKTLASLKSVFDACHYYNSIAKDNFIELEFYVTDDGCTDGTPQAICEQFNNQFIHILKGGGNLFWSRGMYFAWDVAHMRHEEWDAYLLMNDDTIMKVHGFVELLKAQLYCKEHYCQEGIISGITCSSSDPNEITYGGDIIPNKFNGRQIRLGRSAQPQMVDMTNANILLVPTCVVNKIGIFYRGYLHSRADNDYSMMARNKGVPVLITSGIAGVCDNDHMSKVEFRQKIINMSLKERVAYFNHPLHSTSDYLTFMRRNMPFRYPIAVIFRMLETYCPKLYFKINKTRGVS